MKVNSCHEGSFLSLSPRKQEILSSRIMNERRYTSKKCAPGEPDICFLDQEINSLCFCRILNRIARQIPKTWPLHPKFSGSWVLTLQTLPIFESVSWATIKSLLSFRKSIVLQISNYYSLRTSEIHLFYNLQVFYWHFLEILWLFIFLVLYLWFLKDISFVILSFSLFLLPLDCFLFC